MEKAALHGSSGSLRARSSSTRMRGIGKDDDRFRPSHHALRMPYQVAAHTVRPSAVHCFAQRRRPHYGRRRSRRRRRPGEESFPLYGIPSSRNAEEAEMRRPREGGEEEEHCTRGPRAGNNPCRGVTQRLLGGVGSRRNDRSAERVSPLQAA